MAHRPGRVRGKRPAVLPNALLLSLLSHTLLLSLTFGGQGLWLVGFGFPWQDRRIEVADLRIVVVPAQVTAAESSDRSGAIYSALSTGSF